MKKLFDWITGGKQKKEAAPAYPQWENEKRKSASNDDLASRLTLFGHNTCIYCRDVNQVIEQLGLDIKIRNTFEYPEYKQDLLIGGGKTSVPCLKITFQYGKDLWLYDSIAIIDFLENSFPGKNNEKEKKQNIASSNPC